MDKQTLAGILFIVLAAMLWGTTGTAQTFSPLTLSSYWVGTARLVVSALFFILLLGLQRSRVSSQVRLREMPWRAILLGAAGMAVYNLAFFAGVRATSVSVGTAIALGSSPVWAGLLQLLITRQRPVIVWWVAVSIAVTGLVIATVGSSGTVPLTVPGVLLCLGSGLSYAVYAMTSKQVVQTLSPSVGTAVVFMLAAVLATPAAWLLAGIPVTSAADIGVMLWLGVVATGVAYLLFSSGLQYVSSATGVALALAEPITAVCLAVVIVGERPGVVSLLGLGVILVGLALLIRSEASIEND